MLYNLLKSKYERIERLCVRALYYSISYQILLKVSLNIKLDFIYYSFTKLYPISLEIETKVRHD